MDQAEQLLQLQRELKTARCEISNLRQQVKSLKHVQQKNLDELYSKLNEWRCPNCRKDSDTVPKTVECNTDAEAITLRPIGYLSTPFPMKRAIPRQPMGAIGGKLTLSSVIFTNPAHSLEGLTGYSHMWIIFFFHNNRSTHVPAKISPPRLNGDKVGVFATRSPHRPCPLGLSLVRIDSIQGKTIHFSGVDMLDGTPVLDIKPYINQYDDPTKQLSDITGVHEEEPEGASYQQSRQREAPDGEESSSAANLPSATAPSWVNASSPIHVHLSKEAEEQLTAMNKMNLWPTIQTVLREDPRSVYVKQKYSNQFYTFLISDLHVSCKFNDMDLEVLVYRIRQALKFCDCGKQLCRCSSLESSDGSLI